jgi:putative addiction module component (TIGR02574 family)
MSDKKKEVLEAALALTADERAEIAEQLLESLEERDASLDQVAIDASWAAEADRRYQAYKRGEMNSVPIEDVLQMLKGRMR